MSARSWAAVIAIASIGLAPLFSPAQEAGATDVAGIPADNVGVHGPIEPHAVNLELVGHTPIPVEVDTPDGPAVKPIGNNGAPALIGDCAYVGRWHDYTARWGVQIVDVADPTSPTPVGAITEGLPAGAVPREIRAVDLPGFRMLAVLLFARFIDSGATQPGLNGIAFFTVGEDCTQVELAGRVDTLSFRPHEFFLWADPDETHDVDGHPRILTYITAPIGPPNVLVIEATDPADPSIIGLYDAGYPVVSPREEAATFIGTYAHSISLSPDGTEAYLSYWDGGVFTVDTSDFAAASPVPVMRPTGAESIPYAYLEDLGNTHSAVRAGDTNVAVTGDEIYITTDGCPYGWLRTIDLGDTTTPPSQLGEYRLAENDPANCEGGFPTSRNAMGLPIDGTFSMHNQTVTATTVYTSWYGGGLRVIDITDPAAPAEVGAFVPVPVEDIAQSPATSAPTHGARAGFDDDWWVATWSYPVLRDGLIYVTDVRSGLYILRPTDDAPFAEEVASIGFLEGNSNLGGFIQ